MNEHPNSLTDDVIEEGIRLDEAREPGDWEVCDADSDDPETRETCLGMRTPRGRLDGDNYADDVRYIVDAVNHYGAALREVQGLRKAYALLQKGMESQAELMDGLKQETRRQAAELERLSAAIREHHGQKADDRCIEDDDRLYAAAGLPPCDRRVGDKAAMLENCSLFIERRCEGGGWPTYRELEAEVERLRGNVTRCCFCGEPCPDLTALKDHSCVCPKHPLQRGIVILREERDKLAAFKSWTHSYLDAKGIPANPGGPHTAEGCRIGDRMDLVFAELARLRKGASRSAAHALARRLFEGLRMAADKRPQYRGEDPLSLAAYRVEVAQWHDAINALLAEASAAGIIPETKP